MTVVMVSLDTELLPVLTGHYLRGIQESPSGICAICACGNDSGPLEKRDQAVTWWAQHVVGLL